MRIVQVLVLAVGAGLGVFYPFLSVILADRGFDAGGVGLVIALSAVGFTIAVPLWGHVADVVLGRGRALALCAIGAALGVSLLLAPVPAILIAAAIVAFSFFESAWQPLADAITVNALGERSAEYARVRVLTSISFAIASVLSGQLYDRTGYEAASLLLAACAVVLALAALRVPDVGRVDLGAHAPATRVADARPTAPPRLMGTASRARRRALPTWRMGSTGVALRTAPRLGLVMAAVGLVHVGIMGGFTFLPLRLVDLGGGAGDVALMSGLSATAEIPAMLGAAAIVRRIGLRGMFVGAAALYGACIASWIVIDTTLLVVATRALTGVAFAGLVVAVVLTIATLLPPGLQGTGQALYQTIGFGAAAIVANALGGIVYGTLGHAPFFALGAASALAAAVVGWFAIPTASRAARASVPPG